MTYSTQFKKGKFNKSKNEIEMKKVSKAERTIREATAFAVTETASTAHLLFKSAADLTAHYEAKIVSKLCNDRTYDDIIEDRHNETEETQEAILTIADRLKQGIKRQPKQEQSTSRRQAQERDEIIRTFLINN